MFQKICIYQNKVVSLHRISNLHHVKYYFMKNKCCSKYVFSCLTDSHYFSYTLHKPLCNVFCNLAVMFENCRVKNVTFEHVTPDGNVFPAKAWIDKHKNVVVRIYHNDTQQSLNI